MISYKHDIKALLLAVLITFAFTSCVGDKFTDDIVGSESSSTYPYYMTIQVKFDSNYESTRATNDELINGDDIEYGEEKEHFVGKEGNWIILFKDDNFFGAFPLTELKSHNHNSENPADDNIEDDFYDNIEAIYSYSSKFDAEDENDLPTSCLVVLNSSESIEEKLKYYNNHKENVTVGQILAIVENGKDDDPRNIGFSNADREYFILTNSIYFNNNVKQADVEIPEGFIAKSLMAAKPLTIYAERMTSKFSFSEEKTEGEKHLYEKEIFTMVYCEDFTEDANGSEDVKANDDATIHAPKLTTRNYRIRLTGWGINALETQNYIFKNIDNQSYFTGWNNPSNYRAHWSEDPHYNYDEDKKTPLKYPWQYRLAVNNQLDFYQEKLSENDNNLETEENKNYLRNYSFKELNGEDEHGYVNVDKNFKKDRVVYTPENTYDPTPTIYDLEKDFDSRTDLLAGTHLIICANLETDLDNDGTYKANDVYRDRKGIFYQNKKDCFWSLVRALNLAMQSELQMKFNKYEWNVSKGKAGTSQDALTMKNEHYLYYHTVEEWDEAMKKAVKPDPKDNKKVVADPDLLPKLEKETDESGQEIDKLIKEINPYKLYHVDKNGKHHEVTYDYVMYTLSDDLFIDATIKDGDGKVLPWLDGLTIKSKKKELVNEEDEEAPENYLPLKIYNEVIVRYNYKDGKAVIVGPKPKDADTDDIAETENIIKSFILEWMGAVEHFNNGKMYYAAPVKHNAAQVGYSADSESRGDYGVVRNNWYKFRLSDVTKIGTAVDNPAEPIVPNAVITNDQLNMTVDIIEWHKFNIDAPVF